MRTQLRSVVAVALLLASVGVWSEAAPHTRPRLEKKAVLEGKKNWNDFTHLAFSPDGKLLASCGTPGISKGAIRLWDVATAKVVVELPDPQADRLVFSPDGKRLASWNVSADRPKTPIWVWDVASRKRLAILPGTGRVQWMVFNLDGKEITASEYIRPEGRMGNPRTRLVTWSVEKQEELQSRDGFGYPLLMDGYPSIKKPLMIGTGERGLPRASFDEVPYELREAITGEKVFVCTAHRIWGGSFAIDRDEKMIASVAALGSVQLWDRATGKNIATLRIPGARPVLSPDAAILAMRHREGSGVGPNSWKDIRLYEVPSGKLLAILDEVSALRSLLAFSPDGRLLATAEHTRIRLWVIPDAWRKKKEGSGASP